MVSAEECRTLRSCPRQVQFEEHRFWDVLVWGCGCHDQGIWGSGISRFVFRTRDEAGGGWNSELGISRLYGSGFSARFPWRWVDGRGDVEWVAGFIDFDQPTLGSKECGCAGFSSLRLRGDFTRSDRSEACGLGPPFNS